MFGIVWPPPNFQHVALSNMQPTCWIVQHLSFGRALTVLIQWNPDFSNPPSPEPPNILNQTLFPLNFLHSSSIISPPISRTLDFSKLPVSRTDFWLQRDELTLDNSNMRKFRNHLVRMSIHPCYTAAILSRETKRALFYHAKPPNGNHGDDA